MNTLKLVSTLFSMSLCFLSFGQQKNGPLSNANKTTIIAVVNRADWCSVCKENGERFANTIMPYILKGVAIVMNDLTNDSTIEKSKTELKRSSLYKQIYETNRKGIGRMMQGCGFIHGKSKSMASGIVTFIDAQTLKVLGETSIAITDMEMNKIIDTLLNK